MKAVESKRGEVTAFLALIFMLLVAFTGSLMESASLQSAKSYRRADMNRAMESVFAEYQRELLEEYEIFALDGSYETGNYQEENLTDRLSFYGASGMDQEVGRIQLLTDQDGAAFLDQVARYIENKYGLSSLSSLLGDTDKWTNLEGSGETCGQMEEELEQDLSGILTENQQELPAEDNPLPNMQRLMSAPLTELVMHSGQTISEKSLDPAEVVSGRTRQEGYGDFSDVAENKSLSSIAYGEYVLGHFSAAVEETADEAGLNGETENAGALDYEVEYILYGKSSDRENLEAVLQKLLLFRLVPNYVYLKGSPAKQAEVQSLATTLCAVIALPAAAEALAQVLLLAWAFGESVMDLRSLMKGEGVPLTKSDESWQLSLSGLMTLGTAEDQSDGADMEDAEDAEGGVTYRQYLRALLFLNRAEKLSLRTLDLIELDLQNEKGLSWFRADQCISRVEIKSIARLRGGVTYSFQTYYGYR